MEVESLKVGTALRIACVEPCQIEGVECDSGVLWNLSGRGVYLVVSNPLEKGRIVQISFTLPPERSVVRTTARVAWCNPPSRSKSCGARSLKLPPGCGLEFVALDQADLDVIESHIERIRAGVGGRRQG